ncbi:MAG: tetratricopeptide repeat protein [Candidatus Aminicenantes bacterium]|nr:MAG: tetratricopeptide repeat protein [Candidatus Aminicenantes bacterium]
MKIKSLTSKIARISILLTFVFSIPYLSFGQDTVVKGVVTDQEGTPIKDAKITFHDPSRGLKFEIKSDKKGNFIKVGIPPSFYRVSVEHKNYFPIQSQVRLRFGVEEKMSVKLTKIPPKIEDNPDLSKGVDLFRLGNYDEAIKYFEKLIEKFPSSIEGYYNIGLCYLRKGEVDKAVASLEKAVELNPESIEAHFALGECYFSKGETEKAMSTFTQAVDLQPDNPKAHYNLAIVFYKHDMLDEALSSFAKTIELNPKFSSAYYQAALACIKKGDFQKAIEYFESFLKLEPNAPEAGQVETMIEELRKRIRKDSG